MKKLYVVDNQGQYSDHTYWLVIADPEEWDDLEGVLKRGDRNEIEAVASEWSTLVDENASHPLDTLDVERSIFRQVARHDGNPPAPMGPGNYWKSFGGAEQSWWFEYAPKEPRLSRRDAENLLNKLRERCATEKPVHFDTASSLEMFEAAFAAGEFK